MLVGPQQAAHGLHVDPGDSHSSEPSLDYSLLLGPQQAAHALHEDPGDSHSSEPSLDCSVLVESPIDKAPQGQGPAVDHQQRPYYDGDTFSTARRYVEHRLRGDRRFPGFATLEDVLAIPPVLAPPHIEPSSILWRNPEGNSICLVDVVPDATVDAAMGCVPYSVYPPSRNATRAEMVAQMAVCDELDDIHFLKGGNGKGGRVRLNATSYPQPRRLSWSVLKGKEWSAEHDQHVYVQYAYSQSYRPPEDWRAAPMPMPVFDLGCACREAGYRYLSAISQACPPTGCQLLAYQTLFHATVGRHRDNGLLLDGGHCRLGHSEDQNSQIRGSSVMVFTPDDPPMTFALVEPPPGKKPWDARKKEYVYRKPLMVPLGRGTLYILDSVDDENFCHEAWFEESIKAIGAQVRLAFVFRWLSKEHRFFSEGPKRRALVLTQEEEAAKRLRKQNATRSKRNLRGY